MTRLQFYYFADETNIDRDFIIQSAVEQLCCENRKILESMNADLQCRFFVYRLNCPIDLDDLMKLLEEMGFDFDKCCIIIKQRVDGDTKVQQYGDLKDCTRKHTPPFYLCLL